MKHLFITRHADYDGPDYRINELGKQQMNFLAKEIKSIVKEGSIYLVSSTAPRAVDSSMELSHHLHLDPNFEQIQYLWTGSDSPTGYSYDPKFRNNLLDLVNENRDKADALVMVGHLETLDFFPKYFMRKEEIQIKSLRDIEKGEAVHIDLAKKTYQIIGEE